MARGYKFSDPDIQKYAKMRRQEDKIVKENIKTEIEFRDKDSMYTYKTRFFNIQKRRTKKKGQYLYEGERVDISKSRVFDEKSDYNVSKFSVSAKNLAELKKKLKKI